MKRFVLSTLVLVGIVFQQGYGQFNHFSVNGEVNIPSGGGSNISSIGLGASLKAEILISDKFALTANSGFNNFFGRNNLGLTSRSQTAIPVKGGFKYYPSSSFYFEGQLGASIGINDNTSTGFLWSPGLGTLVRLSNSDNRIDVGLRYESWSRKNLVQGINSKYNSFGFVGLRVGYAFEL